MDKADTILWFIGPACGLVGGLISRLPPRETFGVLGWAVAVIAAPTLAIWASYGLVGNAGINGMWNLIALMYAPIAFMLASITCAIVQKTCNIFAN